MLCYIILYIIYHQPIWKVPSASQSQGELKWTQIDYLTTNIMITLFTPKMYSYWLSDNLFNIKFQDFELDVS